MYDFLGQLSQFIINTPSFDVIILIILGLVAYQLLAWYPEYKKWSNELALMNAEGDSVDDDTFAEFEKKIQASTRVNSIITIIRDFVTDSIEISVNDIHVLVSEKVRKPEQDIIMFSSFFLFTGLIFTVYGIFTALQSTFGAGASVDFDQTIIADLLQGFQAAFSSTIIGVFCAFIAKLAQLGLGYVRQPFEYNIKLYAKHVLIPRIGIPEVEKNLGKVVRTLSSASSKLEDASLALIEVSKSARTDTEEVTKTVDHFHETLNVMGKREDSLITAYDKIANNLFALKDSLKDIVAPIDQIRQDMIARDHQVKPQLELIKGIYDAQTELDVKLSTSVKVIEDTHQKLGNFFGKEFPATLNKAIDKMLMDHDSRIEDVHKKIKTIFNILSKDNKLDKTYEKLEEIVKSLQTFKDSIKGNYGDISKILTILKSDSDKINTALEIDGSTIGRKILSVEKLIGKNSKIITQISTTSSSIQDKVETLIQDPLITHSQMKDELGKVQISLNDLSTQVADFSKLRDSINTMSAKINKMKLGNGFISSLFGSKKNAK